VTFNWIRKANKPYRKNGDKFNDNDKRDLFPQCESAFSEKTDHFILTVLAS